MEIANFNVIGVLGDGGFGKVYLACTKTKTDFLIENQKVALKAIPRKHQSFVAKEIEVYFSKVLANFFLCFFGFF